MPHARWIRFAKIKLRGLSVRSETVEIRRPHKSHSQYLRRRPNVPLDEILRSYSLRR